MGFFVKGFLFNRKPKIHIKQTNMRTNNKQQLINEIRSIVKRVLKEGGYEVNKKNIDDLISKYNDNGESVYIDDIIKLIKSLKNMDKIKSIIMSIDGVKNRYNVIIKLLPYIDNLLKDSKNIVDIIEMLEYIDSDYDEIKKYQMRLLGMFKNKFKDNEKLKLDVIEELTYSEDEYDDMLDYIDKIIKK